MINVSVTCIIMDISIISHLLNMAVRRSAYFNCRFNQPAISIVRSFRENRSLTMSVDAPILFPFEPKEFWKQFRLIIREELAKLEHEKQAKPIYETPGLTYKPLYKMNELCDIFKVTRPTIYEWIKLGKLKPYKIRSRLYFLWNDIELLLKPG